MELENRVLKQEDQQQSSRTTKDVMKFSIPSLAGILLFLIPIPFQGKWTIGVGILAESVQTVFNPYLPYFMTGVLFLSVLLTVIATFSKSERIHQSPFLSSLFKIHWFWLSMRVVGLIFAVCTLFKVGPEIIWSDVTGGTVLYALVPVLTTWFLFSALLMPLLLEFGLMELFGTAVRSVMRPVFKLPGRSSIDALASWMGSGTVGVLITTKQFEEGYYTKREAAVIATNFSVASIAFSLVVISFIGLEHLFVQFYSTVVISGLVAAFICPRIPPLSKKEDIYYEPVGQKISEDVPEGVGRAKWAFDNAFNKAAEIKSAKAVVKKGMESVLDIWLGLIPLVMSLGTIALILAEYTSFFNILAYPLVPVLELMQLPEATKAAPAMLVGFADMFLPAVIGAGVESEITRFVIACVSLTQLIYMSEVGILLLKSKIPLSLLDLFLIFIQRTIITLPIIALMAHVFFF